LDFEVVATARKFFSSSLNEKYHTQQEITIIGCPPPELNSRAYRNFVAPPD